MLQLAQTTQPTGMANWTPEQWVAFFGGIIALVTAIVALVKGTRAETKSAANEASIGRTNDRLVSVAKDQIPPAIINGSNGTTPPTPPPA